MNYCCYEGSTWKTHKRARGSCVLNQLWRPFLRGLLDTPLRRSQSARLPALRWCGREGSNLYGFPHWLLRPARLPVPPRPPTLASRRHYRVTAGVTRDKAGLQA
jgi:hypothetical protein